MKGEHGKGIGGLGYVPEHGLKMPNTLLWWSWYCEECHYQQIGYAGGRGSLKGNFDRFFYKER
jgi:hypothetical protein